MNWNNSNIKKVNLLKIGIIKTLNISAFAIKKSVWTQT